MREDRNDGDKPGDLMTAAEKLQRRRRKANALVKGTDKRDDFQPRT